jgi:hypothetical protein
VHQIQYGFWKRKRPTDLRAEPIECDCIVSTVLSGVLFGKTLILRVWEYSNFKDNHLQKHGTNEWHFSINWSTTKHITCAKGQWNVLNHFSQKFEIFGIAHEIH